MIQEPFAHGDSPIHRLDPRLKIVLATLYSGVTAVAMRFPTLLTALLLALVLLGLTRLKPRDVFKRLLLVNGLAAFFWLVLPLTFEGEPWARVGPFVLTRPGIVLAAQITLKSNAIVLAFISLIASMSFIQLGHALNRLHLPDKMVHLLLLTYRYIFVLEQEYLRLIRAAKLRGFLPRTNLHTYQTYAYLIGMLLVRALARAERVHHAMVCRGFNGRFYSLHEFSIGRSDWVWSALLITFIMTLVFLEWITPLYLSRYAV